ncbi:MAG TPA: cysteine desulfurase family protein, partial [Agromyces sp.]|nr:cysteine desulfurase family protein [Agromyces sp.]
MVYLDHAATTPMRREAIEALTAALAVVGNPSSIHSAGQQAKRLLEESRERIAATLGADGIELIFTGNGTEAVNLAIKGLWWSRQAGAPAGERPTARRRILIPGGEHHATLDTVEWLVAHEGAIVQELPVDEVGRIRLDALERALGDDAASVALVSMLWANNEVGTIQPVAEVARLTALAGVPLHVDAIAAYGQLPIDFHGLRRATDAPAGAGLVALSVSAHKIGGPAGIGALVLDRTAAVEPLIHGGGQQRKLRSGTQDVAAAASFAAAAEAVHARRASDAERMSALRDRLIAGALAAVPSARLSGDPDPAGRLPGNVHFSFPGCEGDSLLFLL